MREFFPLEGIHLQMLQDEFQKKKLKLEEDELIHILSSADFNKYWKWQAAIALRKFGSKKSIPFLKQMVEYPNEDVKNVSLLTIAHLGGKEELNFLVSLLDHKKLKKDYVLWAILAFDDEETLEPISDFMRNKLKSYRRPSTKRISGLEFVTVFLDRYSSNPNALEILKGISDLWNKIDPDLQETLKKKTEYFKDN